MKIVKDIREMTRIAGETRREGKRIAFVPTMGYLHEGHMSLVREGKRRGDLLVVSIYVNPAQFNEKSDLEAYPSDLNRDRELLEGEGCHILFMPASDVMYPPGFQTTVDVTRLSKGMCGDSRPGHFSGVATVVAKLFNIVQPHVAIFGEKDYQQLAIIRQLVLDLNFDLEIVGMPVIREDDGLAMSSRNARLSDSDRPLALSLSRALKSGREIFKKGTREANRIITCVREGIAKGVNIDYIEIRDAVTLLPVETIESDALLAVAASIGNTRLIDNTLLKEESNCRESC